MQLVQRLPEKRVTKSDRTNLRNQGQEIGIVCVKQYKRTANIEMRDHEYSDCH